MSFATLESIKYNLSSHQDANRLVVCLSYVLTLTCNYFRNSTPLQSHTNCVSSLGTLDYHFTCYWCIVESVVSDFYISSMYWSFMFYLELICSHCYTLWLLCCHMKTLVSSSIKQVLFYEQPLLFSCPHMLTYKQAVGHILAQ